VTTIDRAARRRNRAIVITLAALAVAVVTVGLVIFQPWLLFVDQRVDEAAPAGTVLLHDGTFVSHAHPTTGTATVIEADDGSRSLSIANLDSTLGPDVHVWLSAAPVAADGSLATAAGDADYIDLGLLKGNQGDQTYEIPADVDLDSYRSVWLWCVSFSVSFGAADLRS
jgi:hypothetical protein